MLKRDEKSSLFISVKNYMEEAVKISEVDSYFMNAFQQDFLQMLFSVLEQQHIQAHKLFSDEKSKLLYNHAVNSLYDMLKWVDFSINKASDCINDTGKLKSIVDQIKEYIALNYSKDISRNDIANKFYLNPDYLSRTFNKETGLSIPEYQAKLRINKAVQLLKSGMSISEAATHIGYDSFSYFSTVFKRMEGMTPAEFRKKHQQECAK
jgi:two-component system response regulator YesN